MSSPRGYDPFEVISLFNTLLGVLNYDKNTAQHEEQDKIQGKLDLILEKLETLERRLYVDGEKPI